MGQVCVSVCVRVCLCVSGAVGVKVGTPGFARIIFDLATAMAMAMAPKPTVNKLSRA